jgi:dTDP-glucose 4,6-dehydratase
VDRSIDGPRNFLHSNTVGVFELLECARTYHQKLPGDLLTTFRFLQVSTDEVFGSLGADGAFVEDTPYSPRSPYSATKASADHLVRAYHETYGLPTLITNCSNNYGPFQYPEKLVPLVTLNALSGQALPVYGQGQNVRDWLHVEDHCEAISAVLERGEVGSTYNIGARTERTNLEIVYAICDALEEILPAERDSELSEPGAGGYRDLVTFVKDRPGHDHRYAIDPSRIERQIGWRAKKSFDAGLKETVRWYIENREWCVEVKAGSYDGGRLGLAATPNHRGER